MCVLMWQGGWDTIIIAESAFCFFIEVMLIYCQSVFPEPRKLLSGFFQSLGKVN